LLFSEGSIPAQRSEHDTVLEALKLKGFSGFELQLVSHRLGQNYTPGFVEVNFGGHDGILLWYMPSHHSI